MGSGNSKLYIAKETFHPFPNEWDGFTSRDLDPKSQVTFKNAVYKKHIVYIY